MEEGKVGTKNDEGAGAAPMSKDMKGRAVEVARPGGWNRGAEGADVARRW